MQRAGVPRRVVVTGMGVVTPIGTTVPDFWAAASEGKLRRQRRSTASLSGTSRS